MKSTKKVLAMALALAMTVTAVPVTNAEAAVKAPKLNTTKKTVYVGQSYTLKLTTPSTWENVKVKTVKTGKKSVATVKKLSTKKFKVTAVKKGTTYAYVKVTGKKNGKDVAKTLKAKFTVKAPTISVAQTEGTIAVGETLTLKSTVKPSNAKVTYTTSDEKVATVVNGTITAVAPGEATITAQVANGNSKTVKVTVKKTILKDAKQTESNVIEATVAGDTKDLKAGDFKVTNTATNATVAVKSATVKKNAPNTILIETFTSMKDAKEYNVVYDGVTVKFTATDGAVAKVGITTTEIAAGALTEVKATTIDKNGVILDKFGLADGDSSKGKVTCAVTQTKGYQDGTKLYLPAVGDTATVKATYHTGTFGTDGKEAGNIEDTFTIKAVDPSVINLNYAVTVSDTAPAWKATSFKANDKVKIGDPRKVYFRITKDDGSEIDNYSDYKVETADKTKLLVTETPLTDSKTAVEVNGVAEGQTYVIIKKDDKVVASLPLNVVGKPVATTLDLEPASVTVCEESDVEVSSKATLKDQYGDAMTTGTTLKSEELSIPTENNVKGTYTVDVSDNKNIVVKGADFNTKGTYQFKITAKNGDKEIVRTFTVNSVKSAAVAQSYAVIVDNPTVDTTITKDTNTVDDIKLHVGEMVNGGAKAYVDQNVQYTIKNAKGETVYEMKDDLTEASKTSAAINAGATTITNDGSLTVNPVTINTPKYDKNLPAGTYSVTAVLYKKVVGDNTTYGTKAQADADKAFTKVTVSSSFTIKDTQDSKVSFVIKDNKFGAKTVKQGFETAANVEITYDGLKQDSVEVIDVDGTYLSNGGAYVKTVKVYVKVSGSEKLVPVTINVNDQIASCGGLK